MKKIDYYLGNFLYLILGPLIIIQNNFIHLFCRLIKFKKKIVYIKLVGGGSLLIAYPSILAVKEKFRGHKLVLVCTEDVAKYAELLQVFDEIYKIDSIRILPIIIFSLNIITKLSFSEFIINLEVHSKLCLIFSNLVISKNTISLLLGNAKLEKYFKSTKLFYNPNSAIYEGYDSISRYLGVEPYCWAEVKNTFQSKNNIQDKNRNFKILGVAPFCSAIYKERELSPEMIAKLIASQLNSDIDEIRIYGGAGDIKESIKIVSYILSTINIKVVNKVNMFSLSEMLLELNSIGKLITIDSGINHIARLLDINIVSYWGPSDPSLRLKGINADDLQIYRKISCSPCVHLIDSPPCNNDNICMKQYFLSIDDSKFWVVK